MGFANVLAWLHPPLGEGGGFKAYGLMSDQFLALSVVLANGSELRVSTDENEDLFWAKQVAGHNFGIVTSVDYKIYEALRLAVKSVVVKYSLTKRPKRTCERFTTSQSSCWTMIANQMT